MENKAVITCVELRFDLDKDRIDEEKLDKELNLIYDDDPSRIDDEILGLIYVNSIDLEDLDDSCDANCIYVTIYPRINGSFDLFEKEIWSIIENRFYKD